MIEENTLICPVCGADAACESLPGLAAERVDSVYGAVVTAAGYETGPGDGSKIGGAVYEVHQKLGTSHNSVLTFGQMRSQGQALEYGPIDCE